MEEVILGMTLGHGNVYAYHTSKQHDFTWHAISLFLFPSLL